MKAIMLAAGEGSRCYPFTYLSPKIAQEVCGIPVLEYMLSWFSGTPEVDKLYIVARNDSAIELLQTYIRQRKSYLPRFTDLFQRLGYHVAYDNPDFNIEVLPANGWGTGGDLGQTIRQITSTGSLGQDFLVCYADYVIKRRLPGGEVTPQLNLTDMIDYHRSCRRALGTVITMALVGVEREAATRFGVARVEEINGFRRIRGFMEKPELKDVPPQPVVNAGIYVIDSTYLLTRLDECCPAQPGTSFEKKLLEPLAVAKEPKIAAHLLDLEAWFDIGTLEQLVDANISFASKAAASRGVNC